MPAAHFMMSENGAVTAAGRGTYLSLGINAARLFSKKFELGFHLEMKAWKGLWPVNYHSDFVNGFNQNYANTLGDAKDSARAEVLYKAINGSESYSFRGTFYGSYAVSFSPFPNRYGGFMLMYKWSRFGVPLHGTYGTIFNPDGYDWLSLSVPCTYNIELSFKPVLFFKNKNKLHQNFNVFQLSLFYRELNWKKAEFDGLKLQQILPDSFLDQYQKSRYFGIGIRYGLY